MDKTFIETNKILGNYCHQTKIVYTNNRSITTDYSGWKKIYLNNKKRLQKEFVECLNNILLSLDKGKDHSVPIINITSKNGDTAKKESVKEM